jgi:diamine N-acetyltransferase
MDAFKNNRVVLRALEPDDIEILFKWENDRSIWEVSNTIAPFSRYVLTKYIESSHLDIYQTRQLRLMIDVTVNGKDKTIGAVDLFDFEPHHLRAGIGVLIGDKDERGKGYAQEALSALMHYVFNTLQLKQVYCNIMPQNTTSINLFKKLGFELIGNKKSWIKTIDGFNDELMFQCINPSYR